MTNCSSRAHSPNFASLHLRHSSFSNPSVALPTSQFILQPFRFFTYVTAHSPTLLSLLLRHRLFTYVTWRAANDLFIPFSYSHSLIPYKPLSHSVLDKNSWFGAPSLYNVTGRWGLKLGLHRSPPLDS